MRQGLASTFLAAALSFAGVASASFAAATQLLSPQANWRLIRANGGDATLDAVAPSTQDTVGASPTLRLSVQKAGGTFNDIQAEQVVEQPIETDHVLHLHFAARSSAGNTIRVVVEQAAAPYHDVIVNTLPLGDSWKPFDVTGSTSVEAAGKLAVRFQVGFSAGQIELRDIALSDDGIDPLITAARDAIAPEKVAARIDRQRKRDVRILVVDPAGRPVPNAAVHVQQLRHAFLFGSNIFRLDTTNQSPTQQAYQNQFAQLFNYATLPFYWGSYEPAPGQRNDRKLQVMADWCAQHGITTKGHPLVYTQVYPAWAPASADEAKPLIHARITDLVTRYRGSIDIWDVVNEANTAVYHPKTGIGQWALRDGPAEVVATCLSWARAAADATAATQPTASPFKAFPHTVFLYNDFQPGEPYVSLLKQLAARGALPDVVGFQSHMHGGNWRSEDVWARTEQLAAFGRPVHFTEVTAVSGAHRTGTTTDHPASDWPSTPAGEQEQADYLEHFYTILFSHPAVHAITYWDLTDSGAWMGAPAGLLRKDMTPKPAYTRLLDLLHRQWWTDAELHTDDAGTCTTRAFLGDYDITANDAQTNSTGATHTSLNITGEPTTIKVTVQPQHP